MQAPSERAETPRWWRRVPPWAWRAAGMQLVGLVCVLVFLPGLLVASVHALGGGDALHDAASSVTKTLQRAVLSPVGMPPVLAMRVVAVVVVLLLVAFALAVAVATLRFPRRSVLQGTVLHVVYGMLVLPAIAWGSVGVLATSRLAAETLAMIRFGLTELAVLANAWFDGHPTVGVVLLVAFGVSIYRWSVWPALVTIAIGLLVTLLIPAVSLEASAAVQSVFLGAKGWIVRHVSPFVHGVLIPVGSFGKTLVTGVALAMVVAIVLFHLNALLPRFLADPIVDAVQCHAGLGHLARASFGVGTGLSLLLVTAGATPATSDAVQSGWEGMLARLDDSGLSWRAGERNPSPILRYRDAFPQQVRTLVLAWMAAPAPPLLAGLLLAGTLLPTTWNLVRMIRADDLPPTESTRALFPDEVRRFAWAVRRFVLARARPRV